MKYINDTYNENVYYKSSNELNILRYLQSNISMLKFPMEIQNILKRYKRHIYE